MLHSKKEVYDQMQKGKPVRIVYEETDYEIFNTKTKKTLIYCMSKERAMKTLEVLYKDKMDKKMNCDFGVRISSSKIEI